MCVMCVHVCVYVHVCICVYVCMYMCVYVCKYMCVYVCMHICVCVRVISWRQFFMRRQTHLLVRVFSTPTHTVATPCVFHVPEMQTQFAQYAHRHFSKLPEWLRNATTEPKFLFVAVGAAATCGGCERQFWFRFFVRDLTVRID